MNIAALINAVFRRITFAMEMMTVVMAQMKKNVAIRVKVILNFYATMVTSVFTSL